MEVRDRREEIVPFLVMVVMEACTIFLTIMAKTAITSGMSPFVFIVYTNSLGSLLLLPFSFYFHKHDQRMDRSIFTWQILVRIFLMGFTGVFMFQNLAFVGLSYSSPIVVCAMGLLIPAFSFILSLLLSSRSLDWSNKSTRIKVLGTLISLSGAIVEVFYKGPFTRPSSSSSPYSSSSSSALLRAIPRLFVYYKASENWLLGCAFLAAAAFSVSAFNVVQIGTVKRYPQVMKVVSFYSIVGTVLCAIFSLIMEREANAWRINSNMELILIISTGIFGSVIRTSFHVKFTKMKGPFYVPLFKPFGIFWAALFGTSFFVNSLHYGSVLGAAVAGVGYYTVTWGQMKENEEKTKEAFESFTDDGAKVPLLHDVDSQV